MFKIIVSVYGLVLLFLLLLHSALDVNDVISFFFFFLSTINLALHNRPTMKRNNTSTG